MDILATLAAFVVSIACTVLIHVLAQAMFWLKWHGVAALL